MTSYASWSYSSRWLIINCPFAALLVISLILFASQSISGFSVLKSVGHLEYAALMQLSIYAFKFLS